MAKIKTRPRAGALSELLKAKGMTQLDAAEKTGVDRKTLARIDDGEDVKRETLLQVANKLKVTEEYFRRPTAEGTDGGDVSEPGTILLRKLDVARLDKLLEGVERLEWHLNAKVRDEDARKFLKDFEAAVENYFGHVNESNATEFVNGLLLAANAMSVSSTSPSLRTQLDRLKTMDDIAARLEMFTEHRLALLGADYLFWEYTAPGYYGYDEEGIGELPYPESYRSRNTVLLSVEPLGTQSRRTHVSIGRPPPLFASDTEDPVFVNGDQLPTRGTVR